MALTVHPTDLADVLVLEPSIHSDARGLVFESFNRAVLRAATGLDLEFVQDNHSENVQWALRGLHYQLGAPQAKLVRVARGRIFDVALDVRRDSKTLGRWVGVELSAENRRQLLIPAGFAHGFLALAPDNLVLYKSSTFWDGELTRTIRFDDPALAIDWPLAGARPVVNERDRTAPLFVEAPLL